MRHALVLAILTPAAAVCLAASGPSDPTATPTPESPLNPVVARVDGDPIRAAELSMVMQTVTSQLEDRGVEPEASEVVDIAMQRVVEQKILAAEARRFGLEPEPGRVEQMRASAERQAGGLEALEHNLAAAGSDLEQLEAMLTEMELARVYIQRQIAPTVELAPEEVRAFYDSHPDLFRHDDVVRARHMVFAPQNPKDPTARARAEKARQRALHGEDFAELARELSDGPAADRGGDLGWFTRQQVEPQIATAAFATDPGEISDVVQSRYGYHVIKVEEYRPAGILPFEEIEDKAATLAHQDKVARTIQELLATLAETVTIEIMRQAVQTPTASDGP